MVVDTSALMAVLLREPEADRCRVALEAEDELLISAGTVAEALIVASRRDLNQEMSEFLARLGFEIAPVFESDARQVAEAHARWGKGRSPASLNFGDCFAYALAKARGCRLLYVGQDFRRTDIEAAI